MIKHWGKTDTGMLVAAVVLLMMIFIFFGLTASLKISIVGFPISLIVLMAIMEYAAMELRRK